MDDLFGDLPVQEPKDGKVCTKCGIRQPDENFQTVGISGYRRTDCISCTNKATKLRAELKKQYPKPDDEYECPICKRQAKDIPFANRSPLVLDHCHETEEFRGWLCDYCNRGLGAFNDSLERLQNAIEYLRTNNGKEEG